MDINVVETQVNNLVETLSKNLVETLSKNLVETHHWRVSTKHKNNLGFLNSNEIATSQSLLAMT